ncbi:MAG: response regulator [Steroidobacteraceae bacterium]|jgi:two-component system, OmpR family, response regulator
MNDSATGTQTAHVLRVLLVEDSQVLAARLREALSTLEQVVVVATVDNEQDATNWVRASVIDVIILDLLLRQGSGFGVLRGLGNHRPAVIMLTNHQLPEYRQSALRLGVDHFLNKASDCDRLAEVIASVRDARSSSEADARLVNYPGRA